MSSINFDFDASELIQAMEKATKQYPASAVKPVFPDIILSYMDKNAFALVTEYLLPSRLLKL